MTALLVLLVVYGTALAVGVALRWVALMAVMLLVQKFADLTIPERPDFLRQTAIIAAISAPAFFLPALLGLAVTVAITGTLLQRWFDADTAAVVIVVVLTGIAEWVIGLAAVGAMGAVAQAVGR